MDDNTVIRLAASSNEINFYTVCSRTKDARPYGIFAVMDRDDSDNALAEKLFFTEEEATQCALWLAENQVFPITLTEVISDLYSL